MVSESERQSVRKSIGCDERRVPYATEWPTAMSSTAHSKPTWRTTDGKRAKESEKEGPLRCTIQRQNNFAWNWPFDIFVNLMRFGESDRSDSDHLLRCVRIEATNLTKMQQTAGGWGNEATTQMFGTERATTDATWPP